METMAMRTAGRMADAAAARLRGLLAAISPIPAVELVPVSPCPSNVRGAHAYGMHVASISNRDVDGTVKPGTTWAFRLTDHARRHSERSP